MTAVRPQQAPPETVVVVITAAADVPSELLPTPMAMESLKQFLVVLSTAAAVGFVSIIFVLRWVFYYKEGLGWDGGLAEFNWHPVLIVIGFIFLQGIGENTVFYLLFICCCF